MQTRIRIGIIKSQLPPDEQQKRISQNSLKKLKIKLKR